MPILRKRTLFTIVIDGEAINLHSSKEMGDPLMFEEMNAQLQEMDIPLELSGIKINYQSPEFWLDSYHMDDYRAMAVLRKSHATKKPKVLTFYRRQVMVEPDESGAYPFLPHGGDLNTASSEYPYTRTPDVRDGCSVQLPVSLDLDTGHRVIIDSDTTPHADIAPHVLDVDSNTFDHAVPIDITDLAPSNIARNFQVHFTALRSTWNKNTPVIPVKFINRSEVGKAASIAFEHNDEYSDQFSALSADYDDIYRAVSNGGTIKQATPLRDASGLTVPPKTDVFALIERPNFSEFEPTNDDPSATNISVIIPTWARLSKIRDWQLYNGQSIGFTKRDVAANPITGRIVDGFYLLVTPNQSNDTGILKITNGDGGKQYSVPDVRYIYLDSSVTIDTLPDELPPQREWAVPMIRDDRAINVVIDVNRKALIFLPFDSPSTTMANTEFLKEHMAFWLLYGRYVESDEFHYIGQGSYTSEASMSLSTFDRIESEYMRAEEIIPSQNVNGKIRSTSYVTNGERESLSYFGEVGVEITIRGQYGGLVDNMPFKCQLEWYRTKEVTDYLCGHSDVKPTPFKSRILDWVNVASSTVDSGEYKLSGIDASPMPKVTYIENFTTDNTMTQGFAIIMKILPTWQGENVDDNVAIRLHRGAL